jgi:hypothetical protein
MVPVSLLTDFSFDYKELLLIPVPSDEDGEG